MERINLMVMESHSGNLETLNEVLNNHPNWQKIITVNAEDAIEKLHQQDFDFLLLNSKINSEEERKMVKLIKLQQPNVIILRYNDEEIESVENEILLAIKTQKENNRPVYSITDNVF